jgi:hypothetical protein
VVQTTTETLDLISGEQQRNIRQYLFTFQAAQGTGRISLLTTELLPELSQKKVGSEFVVPESVDYLLRVIDPENAFMEGKAYASAPLELLCRKDTGHFAVHRAWPRGPFLVTPSASKLIVLEREKPVAFTLPECRVAQVYGLTALFPAAGSDWEGGPARPLPRRGADEPPDYLGLTDDWDYGSADGGLIRARFIYDHTTGQRRQIPMLLSDPDGGEPFAVWQARKTRDQWLYLCRQSTKEQDSVRMMATESGKIIGRIAPQATEQLIESWNADDGVVLLHSRMNPLRLGKLNCVVWRYKTDPTHVSKFEIDFAKLFEMRDDEFVVRPRG